MRIRQLEVVSLFNLFRHTIRLNDLDRITIIHGPNGFGKTVILRMLDGLLSRRYSIFRSVPFSEFNVTFDDRSVLSVTKPTIPSVEDHTEKRKRRSRRVVRPIVFTLTQPGQDPQVYESSGTPRGDPAYAFSIGALEHFIPFLERVGPDRWVDRTTAELVDLDEIMEVYGDQLPPEFKKKAGPRGQPDWLREVSNQVLVRLIRTQRLETSPAEPDSRHSPGSRNIPAVRRYSDELAREIQSTLTEYAARSQDLDRTFPSRLFTQHPLDSLAVPELRSRLGELESYRAELTTLGFLDPEKDPTPLLQIEEAKRDVLSIYVQDAGKKLSVFDAMAAKIKLLLRTVNSRFQYKKVSIHKERGFVFTTPDGSDLPPTGLSSGEQHELVLLYELLFKTQTNSIVLIDEPEISLHIAWQEKFLGDLQDVVRLSKFDVLIATHSPEIISDRWDLTVELKGPE